MKIAVIGGGSTYTPELIKGFLERTRVLPLTELWLMDTAPERLTVVGGFARRIVENYGAPFKVVLTGDQKAAVAGASYVITQVRVGMMPARRADEYLGKRHGLVGQETTGIGGMAKALRTIPVILGVARDMAASAPKGLLVNFTNPSGLVTEALFRYAPQVAAVGLCNGPITFKMGVLEVLAGLKGEAISEERAELDTLGLNHLSWHRGLKLDGEDIWPQVLKAYVAELRQSAEPEWDADMIETLGMIPNGYLQYFYHTDHKLALQEAWPPSRGEQVMEIEANLLREYADPALKEPPADLMKRGGAYYSTVATQLISAHFNNLGETHVANVRHNGAVPGWPADWVLEMPVRVDAGGIHPLPAKPLPPVAFGLLAQVKMYEQLTVEAAVHGDRKAAYEAILAHPLGPKANRVKAVLEDLLETHKAYLPQFYK
jgi:6-phospho-beta-glucosidase